MFVYPSSSMQLFPPLELCAYQISVFIYKSLYDAFVRKLIK